MKNKFPQIVACLMLIAAGCGRNSAPQKTPEPVVVTKQTRDTVYLNTQDFAIGDDCSSYALALDKNATLLGKCENEINGLLANNEALKVELDKCQTRPRKEKNIIKDSYNTDNSETYNLKNSNQILAKDNARLRADSTIMADKLKNVGNTDNSVDSKEKTKQKTKTGIPFWWVIIAFAGGIGSTKLASWVKKKGFNLPFPIGAIINFIA